MVAQARKGRQLGRVPESRVLDLAQQVARCLEALHAQGAVHRDVKPENLMLTPDDEVRLMDLGIACVLDEMARLTSTGRFLGSPHYAAPEQFEGAREVVPASDLYSLGVVLYEAVTGVQPFAAEGMAAIMRRHLEHEPPRLRELDPQLTRFLEEVVACLLEKEPARRFASAEQLAEILEEREESSWWREHEEARRAASARRASRPASTPSDGSPVADARIAVKMISTTSEPQNLASGLTDSAGALQLDLPIPPLRKGSAALIVTARSSLGTAEIKQLL